MNEFLFSQYYKKHFERIPRENYEWHYKSRDMLDEWVFEFIAVVIFCLIGSFGFYNKGDCYNYLWLTIAIIGLIGCLIAAMWILGVTILRRFFMKFKLTQDHFEYTHGMLTQKVETFQLSDIIEIDLRRSWWERIIRTGTIIIRFKNGIDSQTNPLVIRGIGKFQEMFDEIDYYRNHHRLVLYFGI